MKKHKFFNIFWLLTLFSVILTGCGGGGGDGVTLEYMPNFSFGGSGGSSGSMINRALIIDDEPTVTDPEAPGYAEAMYTIGKRKFVMFSPFLVGFDKVTTRVKNGDVIRKGALTITVSISGNNVKLAGVVDNGGGYINVTLNTVNRTFSYEQRLNIQTQDGSEQAVVYVKVDNVQLDQYGFYQTNKGKVYVAMQKASAAAVFVGKMEYRSAIGNDNFTPCHGERIVGAYGYQRAPQVTPIINTDVIDLSDADFLALFNDCDGPNWEDVENSGMVVCYNRDEDKFYGADFGLVEERITDITTIPWSLLPDTPIVSFGQ